jgi:hypothetical protein
MPVIEGRFAPDGRPILTVLIDVSPLRLQALQAARLAIPAPVTAQALVDTGAYRTSIDPTVVQALSLTPTGLEPVPVHTLSTGGAPHLSLEYDVSVGLFQSPALATTPPYPVAATLPVLESNLSGFGVHVLIGRDILNRCMMIYDKVRYLSHI